MRYALATAMCGLLLMGCAAPVPPDQSSVGTTRPLASASQGKLTINDPCPARLHDLCGPLLLYYATNMRLPERIEELAQVSGFESVGPFRCPESDLPYVYNPRGVIGANVIQRGVLYDAQPTHGGYRWVIVVEEPSAPNAPLVTKVVAWSEARFPKPAAAEK